MHTYQGDPAIFFTIQHFKNFKNTRKTQETYITHYINCPAYFENFGNFGFKWNILIGQGDKVSLVESNLQLSGIDFVQ